jgi:hypothetical protein
MFAQVVQGRTTQPKALGTAFGRWMEELAAGAVGWLGTSGGVTGDGRVIALIRFDSAAAADRNAQRPDQGARWTETEALCSGRVLVRGTDDVEVHGDVDRAGFVQVVQGRSSDLARVKELEARDRAMASFRPDVLGSVAVWFDDGLWTLFVYCVSEAAARAGERKDPPPEMRALMEERAALAVGTPEFFDLSNPVLLSPGSSLRSS